MDFDVRDGTGDGMKMAWCWRCRKVVPMLDEAEFALINDAYRAGAAQVKLARSLKDRPLVNEDREVLYSGVLARYREIAGEAEVEPEEILRHRLAELGPPCENCGKELRTSLARKCLECGHEASYGFRPLDDRERGLLEKLFEADFPGRDGLRAKWHL